METENPLDKLNRFKKRYAELRAQHLRKLAAENKVDREIWIQEAIKKLEDDRRISKESDLIRLEKEAEDLENGIVKLELWDFNISSRLYSVLKKTGKPIEELVMMSDEELLELPNLGKKSLLEFRKMISDLDIYNPIENE